MRLCFCIINIFCFQDTYTSVLQCTCQKIHVQSSIKSIQWSPDNSHKKYLENLCELSGQKINHILPCLQNCVWDDCVNNLVGVRIRDGKIIRAPLYLFLQDLVYAYFCYTQLTSFLLSQPKQMLKCRVIKVALPNQQM